MSLFRDIAEGFANGIIRATGNGARSSPALGSAGNRIEACCAQLGWDIDEREGGTVKLHFKDTNAREGVRKVCISEGDSDLPHVFCLSHAILPCERVPDQLPGYLLARNYHRVIGAWSVCVTDGNAAFLLEYSPLGDALSALALKVICEQMVAEVSEFDAKMRSAGLL